MTSAFDFDELPELASRLHISFRSGRILLENQRMVLLHTRTLGSLRKEMVETLGLQRARGILTRMGYASGRRDAEMVREIMPNASDEEIMNLGPQLHSLEGIVDVKPIHFDIDIARGTFHGEFAWHDAYEAEVHLEHFGMHHEAVCWMQVGYASGYTSAVVRRPVIYREENCVGKGDGICRIVGYTVDEWPEDITEELKYFEPDRVADQIVELQTQVEHLRYSLDHEFTMGDMVGVSEAFRSTAEMIQKAAENVVTVLLLGETGVGKEMFARALHEMSPRANSAFVAVNCAAMPEELIESELFGVEKGAFTGAQQSRPGRFERAHGGTLFLDEVGELSMAAQAKLLRVLQEGEIERVGDIRTRHVNVRLIAATNTDLLQAVKTGRFRADLYYRLNIYPVLLPPLRERQEDIPLLVQRFLDKYNARHSKRITGVTDRSMNALQAYEWPGNIRELENMIERGVILVSNGNDIDVKDLFPSLEFSSRLPGGNAAVPSQTAPSREQVTSQGDNGEDAIDTIVQEALASGASLESLEKRLMETAVEMSDGNLSSAARRLNITRAQLAYRLKKLG